MAEQVQSSFQRIEKKYLLTPEQYRLVKAGMAAEMEPDRYGSYTICNVYYDTADDLLIRTSLEKPIYKEKLRLRSYGVPGDHDKVFVELKKKYDGVVYKRRILLDAGEAVPFLAGEGAGTPEECGQIGHEIQWFLTRYDLSPRVFLAYQREAYAGRQLPDLRITFDTQLRWRNWDVDLRKGDQGRPLLPEDQILMELKVPGAVPLWLAHLLSQGKIYPTSFSKYGTYYTQQVLGTHQPVATKKEERSCA